jgi:hypothetical protein
MTEVTDPVKPGGDRINSVNRLYSAARLVRAGKDEQEKT